MKPGDNKTGKAAGTQNSNATPGQTADFYNKLEKNAIWLCLGLVAMAAYIVFKDFISFKKIYLFRDIGSDSINIYFPALANMSDLIKNGDGPGWSFSQGMGQNLFPFWWGDLFTNFLTYFDKTKIPYGLALMEVAKLLLIGFVFYRFLKEVKLSNFSALVFSLLFTFSGFIILGGCWAVFSTEALYMTIVLYGFERWLNHRKFFWFVTGLAGISFLQPFYLFPYTFFLAPYIIARYYDVNAGSERKDFIIFLAKTVGLAVLAVLLTSYQLFADLLQYIESPRVGGESSFFAKLQQQSLFGVAEPWLRFTTTFRAFSSDMIGTGSQFKGWQNYLEAPLFYCGLFCLLVFPQFFSSLNKRQKVMYGVITGLFCLPILFPYFRYLFWAFTGDYYRALSLVIVLWMVMFSARAMTYIEQQGKVNRIVLGVTLLLLLILLYTPAAQFKQGIDTGLRGFATFLLLVYAALIFVLGSNSASKNVAKIFIILLCFVEVAWFSSITVNKRDVVTGAMLKEKVGYNDYTVESVDYLKKADNSFYRINKEYSSGLAIHQSINDAKVFGFYGTPSYFSFNQKNYIKFLGDLDVINVKDENSTRWARGLVDRPILFSLVAGKYWLTKRTDNSLSGLGFDSIAKFGDVKVLKNRFAMPFGVTYSKVIDAAQFKTLSPSQKDFAIMRACVIDDEIKADFTTMPSFAMNDTLVPMTFDNYGVMGDSLKKESFSMTKFSQNNFAGNITVSRPKVLFFAMPFDEGWSATLNGQPAKLYRLNCGLTGLMTKAGSNTVEMRFTPRHKNTGRMVSIVALLAFIGLLGFAFMKNRNSANTQQS